MKYLTTLLYLVSVCAIKCPTDSSGYTCPCDYSPNNPKVKFPDAYKQRLDLSNENYGFFFILNGVDSKTGEEKVIGIDFDMMSFPEKANVDKYWNCWIGIRDISGSMFAFSQQTKHGNSIKANADPFLFECGENYIVKSLPNSPSPGKIGTIYEAIVNINGTNFGDNVSITFKIKFMDNKGPVLQGNNGLLRQAKGVCGNLYYYSVPWYIVIDVDNVVVAINRTNIINVTSGVVWLDRQMSSSVVDDDIDGWVWFEFNLFDGHRYAFMEEFTKEIHERKYVAGLDIPVNKQYIALNETDFNITYLNNNWTSPITNMTYPLNWVIDYDNTSFGINVWFPEQEEVWNVSKYFYVGMQQAFFNVTNNKGKIIGMGFTELVIGL